MTIIILNLLTISIIVSIIIDLSGIIDSIKFGIAKIVSNITKVKVTEDCIYIPKIFICSSCITWWSCLFYIILTNNFSLMNLLLCALAHFFSINVTGFLQFFRELLVYLENKLYKFIQ